MSSASRYPLPRLNNLKIRIIIRENLIEHIDTTTEEAPAAKATATSAAVIVVVVMPPPDRRSLAIQLTRGPPPQVLNAGQRESPKEHPADEMWMYDKGYNLFQPQYTSLFIATVNTY
uniref:Uncharacterized protein n=1 Tax=Vespula pensylvanica TaxID=30213 RepID=A0A834NYP8_VESPE|nr:hypothetical protein H0235_009362 [Vespula pensylvanica]